MKTTSNFWSFTWVIDFIKWIGSFFSEISPTSLLRLESFMIVVTGCGILIYQCIISYGKLIDWLEGGAFIAAGLISKVTQKAIEVKGQQAMQALKNGAPVNEVIKEVTDIKTT